MFDALKDIDDMGLIRLREEHKRDPLWCDMRFGEWLELHNAFREERGHARGFKKGVKAGLARAEGSAPPVSMKTLALIWSVLVPSLAVVNTLLLLLAIRLMRQEHTWWLVLVMILLPVTVVTQSTGTYFLVARLYNWCLKRPDEGEVIVIKIPVDTVDKEDEEYSSWGTGQITDAINKGTTKNPD
jgi:hypothetical protein